MRLFRLFFMAFVISSLLYVGSSAKLPVSSTSSNAVKRFFKGSRDLIRDIFDTIIQNGAQNSPVPPSAPEKIQGLATIKQYLYEIGYLVGPPDPSFTDIVDDNFIQALRDYQNFYKLNPTGTLDNSTLQKMSLPRCRVPDNISTQTTLQTLVWPGRNNWLKGMKNITYGFLPESKIPTDMMVVIEDAFNRWSNATAINFTKTAAISAANITVGFYSFVDLFNSTMYGDVVLELDSQGKVTVGAIRLDAGKYWVLPSVNDSFIWPFGAVDLETVVMHHIGHLLGLPHSSAEEAVMYPYILSSQERKVQPSTDDRTSLQNLNASSGDRERNAVMAVLSSLLVGLACMVLLI